MMKKILFAFLLAAMLPIAGEAQQVSVGPGLVRETLTWRTNKTNAGGLGAVFDSTVLQRSAAWSGSVALTEYRDTTAAISLMDAYIPNLKGNWLTQSHLAADSFHVARLSIHPSTGTALADGADTVFASLQFSFNGVDWVAGNPVTIILLETGTSNTFVRIIHSNVGANVGEATAATNAAFWPFPLMRLIILSDLIGEFEATLTYYTNRQSKL